MTHPNDVVNEVNEVFAEYKSAAEKFPAFNSGHEGWAVIKEELDELWMEVRLFPYGNKENMKKEAKQVAAMALRFMVDCCR